MMAFGAFGLASPMHAHAGHLVRTFSRHFFGVAQTGPLPTSLTSAGRHDFVRARALVSLRVPT